MKHLFCCDELFLLGIIKGDEIIMINEKQVTGMKPLTLQQQFKGMNIYN